MELWLVGVIELCKCKCAGGAVASCTGGDADADLQAPMDVLAEEGMQGSHIRRPYGPCLWRVRRAGAAACALAIQLALPDHL